MSITAARPCRILTGFPFVNVIKMTPTGVVRRL
jgi:hypothetical protein